MFAKQIKAKNMILKPEIMFALTVLFIWLFVMPSVFKAAAEEIKAALLETPQDMHKAAEIGDVNTVRVMLEQGVDINLRDSNGNTPLFLASRHGHFHIVQFLIENGADVNVKCQNRITPLWAAAKRRSIKIINLLIDKGAEMNLLAASVLKDNIFFETYFKTGGNVNQKFGDLSLIHVVASTGAGREIVEILIANGADVNEKNEQGWTPLHLAATCRNPQTAEALITHGADIHSKTIYGQTPLHCASYSDCPQVTELLIACGAEIDETSKGETPLYTAIENGYPEVVRVLVANGADVNASDRLGNTLLHKAVGKEYSRIRRLPFEPGLKILNHNYLEIVKVLIENGADINAKWGMGGLTPLYCARSPEMIELLQAYGAKKEMYWWAELLQTLGVLKAR